MKLLATTLIMSMTLATTSAMADQSISTNVDIQNTAELNKVFDTTQIEKLQVLELKNKEMKDTQGAFVPFIPVAIAVGARFVTNQFISHQIRNGTLIYGTYNAANSMQNRR